jgi:hypothetical protein
MRSALLRGLRYNNTSRMGAVHGQIRLVLSSGEAAYMVLHLAYCRVQFL